MLVAIQKAESTGPDLSDHRPQDQRIGFNPRVHQHAFSYNIITTGETDANNVGCWIVVGWKIWYSTEPPHLSNGLPG